MYPITGYGYAGVHNMYRSGPVPPVDRVPQARGAISTKSVNNAEGAEKAAAVKGLPNGDIYIAATGGTGYGIDTEPEVDVFTAQRVWSA